MIHDEELDLFWADSPPAWLEFIGPMKEVWGNPIFQRRYVMRRLLPFFGVKKAFLIGLGISFLINLLLFFADSDQAPGLGLMITVAVPMMFIGSIVGMRLFTTCLIGTPMEMRAELYSGMLGSVLAAPIPDRKIFTAECISGLMRGLGAIEEVVALMGGLVIPYVIINFKPVAAWFQENWPVSFWLVILLLMIVIFVILFTVLAAVAAGLYSIILPTAATVGATVAHLFGSFLVLLTTGISANLLFFTLVPIEIEHVNPVAVLILIAVLNITVLLAIIAQTGQWGVRAMARARRPGFYEPDRMNAAGYLKAQDSGQISFGGRI